MFERRLCGRLHVGQDALSEVPAEEFVGDTVWVIRVTTHRVKCSSINPVIVGEERDDFIAIL